MLNVNSEYLGFKNIQKRSIEAFNKVLMFGVDFLYHFQEKSSIFLYFENIKKRELSKMYKIFVQKLREKFIGFRLINVLSYNSLQLL